MRQKLVESGDVDVMIAVRSNFFYTRTVPCELWFLNRNKPEEMKGKVLMIDARSIYRKVTRKIYDFSSEQEQNLLAIVWLYRGQRERFLELVCGYCGRTINQAAACAGESGSGLAEFASAIEAVAEACGSGQRRLSEDSSAGAELAGLLSAFRANAAAFGKAAAAEEEAWKGQDKCSGGLGQAVERLAPLSEASRALGKQTEQLFKLAGSLAEGGEGGRRNGKIAGALKAADEARQTAAGQLRQVRYFWRQAAWLVERFPEARLRDVEGLVKLASIDEIAANDWSLTPGRYVGVAPEEVDGDFDFEEALREIHVELEDLNAEAARLAETIKRNFQELGI